MRLGALLALPPADAARLPVTSVVGRRLVTALRDHGAYVAGVSDGDTVQLRADLPAVTGYGTATGHPFVTDRELRAELRAAIAALAVVADNGPASVGGTGPRRAAPAAPLAKGTRNGVASRPSASASPASNLPPPAATPAPGAASGSSAGLPSAPVTRADPAPPGVVAAIAALALALLGVGLRAGRGLTRLFS